MAMFVILFIAIKKQAPSKKGAATKKQEILDNYEQRLCEALTPLQNSPDFLRDKRMEMLKLFTKELSLNVFFDQQSLREAIRFLSAMECN